VNTSHCGAAISRCPKTFPQDLLKISRATTIATRTRPRQQAAARATDAPQPRRAEKATTCPWWTTDIEGGCPSLRAELRRVRGSASWVVEHPWCPHRQDFPRACEGWWSATPGRATSAGRSSRYWSRRSHRRWLFQTSKSSAEPRGCVASDGLKPVVTCEGNHHVWVEGLNLGATLTDRAHQRHRDAADTGFVLLLLGRVAPHGSLLDGAPQVLDVKGCGTARGARIARELRPVGAPVCAEGATQRGRRSPTGRRSAASCSPDCRSDRPQPPTCGASCAQLRTPNSPVGAAAWRSQRNSVPGTQPLHGARVEHVLGPSALSDVDDHVGHVEVLQIGSVKTPTIGRPRPLPPHRRAHPNYILNCEEPSPWRATEPLPQGFARAERAD